MIDYTVMRDLQAGGRYLLYAVLFAMAFGGSSNEPALQYTLLALLIVGVPAYWFWSRSWHDRRHHLDPSPTCSHCRGRLAYQRKLEEQERMRRMNHNYPGGPY